MNNGNEVWLSAEEIAKIVGVSVKSFQNKANKKGIKSKREITPTGWIAKYLVSSLPTQWQEQVNGLLQIGTTGFGNVLRATAHVGTDKDIIAVGSYITSEVAELNAPYIISMLNILGFESADYHELTKEQGCSIDTGILIARKRAIVRWWREMAKTLPAHQVEAFAYNTCEALKKMDEVGKIGKCFFTLKNSEMPRPKMLDNTSASKLDSDIQAWLEAHYANGNRPSGKAVWKMYCQVRNSKGWEYVSYQTIHNWLKSIKAKCDIERQGLKNFKLQTGLATMRVVPEFGDVWSMDGTPVNVWVVNDNFQARQCAYKGVCVDAGTGLAVAVLTKTETIQMYKDTFISMVRATRRLPKIVQIDHFGGFVQFTDWLALYGVTVEKPSRGNPRAKIVEAVLGHISNQIERYHPAFNGMNTTAKEGRLSDEFRDKQAIPEAISWREAKNYVEKITPSAWNNHVMERLEGKPCGKTPLELFLEKSKTSPLLNEEDYARIVGFHHCIRLGVNGLQYNQEYETYSFLPDYEAWGAKRIAQWLLTNKGRSFNLYTIDHKRAYVIDVQAGKDVGWFNVRHRVEMSPTLWGEAGKAQMGQDEAIRKAMVAEAKGDIARAKEMYPGAFEDLAQNALPTSSLELVEGVVVDTSTGEVLSPLTPEGGMSMESVLKGSVGKDSLNEAEEACKMEGLELQTQTPKPKKAQKTKNQKPEIDKANDDNYVLVELRNGELRYVPKML